VTATALPLPASVDQRGATDHGSRLSWVIPDTITITWRNLKAYGRNPDSIFFSSVQPIMFVILFRYVFGGAIHPPGVTYANYLMPGIYVQTLGFGVMATSIGLSEDLHKGLIERFRSLPMVDSAVLLGRTAADSVRNICVIVLLTVVGYLVGFRVLTGLLPFLAACALLLFFGWSLMWGAVIIGLTASSSETAQLMVFPLLFPLTFASSAFVPVATMPGWLQGFARNQPISAAVDATRALMIGGPTAEPVMKTLIWSGALIAVLIPLAVHRFSKIAS
jgi:ABC-2 type transport system permease protein/oleandomycin transport system permease protein